MHPASYLETVSSRVLRVLIQGPKNGHVDAGCTPACSRMKEPRPPAPMLSAAIPFRPTAQQSRYPSIRVLREDRTLDSKSRENHSQGILPVLAIHRQSSIEAPVCCVCYPGSLPRRNWVSSFPHGHALAACFPELTLPGLLSVIGHANMTSAHMRSTRGWELRDAIGLTGSLNCRE